LKTKTKDAPEIRSDRWEQTIREAVLDQLANSFAFNQYVPDCDFKQERVFGDSYEYSDTYKTPDEYHLTFDYGQHVPNYDCPITTNNGYLENGKLIWSNKRVKEYDDMSQVIIHTSEYCMSNREFERHAHRAIKRLKEKPNFWAIVYINEVYPFNDAILAGMAIGHD
jgi:hypothetical protein